MIEIRNITGVGDFGCPFNLKQIYRWLRPLKSKKKTKKKAKKFYSVRSQTMSESDEHNEETQKKERRTLLVKPKTKKKKKHHIKPIIEVRYSKKLFKALTLRILYPVKATIQLFHTGKAVCIGTKSLTELEEAGRQFCNILIMLHYQPRFDGFRVCNLLGTWSINHRLNIEKLYTEHGGIFEPELFPAMQYYVGDVTLLIFRSGKIIATGAKSEEDLTIAHDKVSSILNVGDYFK